ncbi:hypothetical protein HPB50_024088 [Hyalomma asiaticum]|uniref:Uncharacterized protein n=1 Tax=Hyalomma asiaticum TaxID=266040 RepID=A0ACB7SQH8_HYAAI|nr:hypothetical protein HPB50_024088 [Hyalomma asiaticum]
MAGRPSRPHTLTASGRNASPRFCCVARGADRTPAGCCGLRRSRHRERDAADRRRVSRASHRPVVLPLASLPHIWSTPIFVFTHSVRGGPGRDETFRLPCDDNDSPTTTGGLL